MNDKLNLHQKLVEDIKDIPGYEGEYAITKCGEVWSYKNNIFLKSSINRYGYKYVNLSKNNSAKTYKIHRLVAITYLDNPNNLKEINHKDENKLNNNIENLEWCDRKYNINYGNRNKKTSCKMKGHLNPKARKVRCIETGEIFETIREANKYLGRDEKNSNISRCCKGKLNSTGKHPITNIKLHWEYTEV